MKKFYLSALLALSISFSYAQGFESAKQIFESPKLKTEIAKHKTVAILPFETKITYKKQPKNFSAEANREQEKSMSKSIQASLYTFLLRKANNYTVTFQDVDKTNILLKKAGVMDKLDEMTRDELAKILGVDAVLGGRFEQEQTNTQPPPHPTPHNQPPNPPKTPPPTNKNKTKKKNNNHKKNTPKPHPEQEKKTK
jgi:hypothetical protein